MGISCSIYDQLELASMHGHNVRLMFDVQNSEHKCVEGVVKNIYASKGKEYVLMNNGDVYCLDYLLSMDMVNH